MSDHSSPVVVNVGGFGARRSWFFTILSVVLIGYLLCVAWSKYGEKRPQLNSLQSSWVGKAVSYIADDIAKNKGEIDKLFVYTFSADPSCEMTTRMYQTLQNRGAFTLLDKSLGQKISDQFGLPSKYNENPTADLVSIGKYVKSRRADAALAGRIVTLQNKDNLPEVVIDVEYWLIDNSGAILYSGRCDNAILNKSSIVPEVETVFGGLFALGWPHRLLFWTLFVLIFPIVTISFLKSQSRKRSNSTNAFTLILYTIIDGIVAYLLLPPDWNNIVPVLIFVGMILVSGCYNLIIIDFARKLETE